MKSVFVTVGTTSFDELIENITSSENVQVPSRDKKWYCFDFFLVVFLVQCVCFLVVWPRLFRAIYIDFFNLTLCQKEY